MASSTIPAMSIWWTSAVNQILHVEFELAQALVRKQAGDLHQIVASFASVGGLGGFARAFSSPFDSSLALVKVDLSVPTRPAFELTAKSVDVRAFQLLRHCAWRWSAQAVQVRSIVISDHTPGQRGRPVQLPDAKWTTEDDAYPPLSQMVQYGVDREDPADYMKERRCVVEFSQPLLNNGGGAIAVITAWIELLTEGAFALPVRVPNEAQVWQEDLNLYDNYSIELAISLFEASEAAWNTLLNCLDAYSCGHERITLVTIA